MSLNQPEVVADEYATERGIETRRSVYAGADGPDPNVVLWELLCAARPRAVLEVGPGPGELSARIVRELGADVVAIDVSERMVELAGSRGVDARLGDVQSLPFPSGSFDVVVAAWMLYHVPDLDRGLREIERVLVPGGRLIAVTNSERHLEEARALAGASMVGRVPFSRENGADVLLRHFADVVRHDVDAWVVFPDADAVRRYLRSTILMREAADRVPELHAPLRAGSRTTVFIATKSTA